MTIYDFYKYVTEDYKNYALFLVAASIIYFVIRNLISYVTDNIVRVILTSRAPLSSITFKNND